MCLNFQPEGNPPFPHPLPLRSLAPGAYDLLMAHAVASRSQKDPKEYLPFLHGLQALPTPRPRGVGGSSVDPPGDGPEGSEAGTKVSRQERWGSIRRQFFSRSQAQISPPENLVAF